MTPVFVWTTFDVRCLLPEGWRQAIGKVAARADCREFPRTPILSREAEDVQHTFRGRVHAEDVQQDLPWLYELYRGEFLELARKTRKEAVEPALDYRYGIVLNVQRGNTMRFECHVDSNPMTGLLFCTDHPEGDGELVVGHDPQAIGLEAIEKQCTAIRPRAGELIFFDGKTFPHYARALSSELDMRVVAIMNFYTESCPETTRPPELNLHRFGTV